MAVTLRDTRTLMGVQRNLKPVPNYWLALLFPMTQTFDTETIDFDVIEGGRRIAPFVAPTSQGKVMKSEGFEVRSFKPAYVKPKHVVNPNKQLSRLAGEGYTGTLSPADRMDLATTDNLRKEREMIERRWEAMAAEAAITGKVTVSGELYPTQVVDFGRDAGQTITLGVGSKWGDTGVSIMEDIESWMTQTQLLSGYAPDRITVSPEVWNVMRKDTEVLAALDTTSRGSTAGLDTGVGSGLPVQRKGTLGATLELYVYNDIYEDDTGATVRMLASGQIVLSSSGMEGVRAFGAILDVASMQAVEMFPKMWPEQDPSVIYTMTQSAPLMIPTRPNAILLANVL